MWSWSGRVTENFANVTFNALRVNFSQKAEEGLKYALYQDISILVYNFLKEVFKVPLIS